MYCPKCGKVNSPDQRFCRSCGQGLEKAAESLAEQTSETVHAQRASGRQLLVERMLVALGAAAGAAAVGFLLFRIITRIIIARGELLQSLGFTAILLAAAFAVVLVIYREFVLKPAANRRALVGDEPSPTIGEFNSGTPTTRQLADNPDFEPISPVTESTTELLVNNRER